MIQFFVILSFLKFSLAKTTIQVDSRLICCSGKRSVNHVRSSVITDLPPGCESLGVKDVELWEHDYITPDDFKKTVETNGTGYFELDGYESWDPSVQFYMKAFHQCDLADGDVTRVRIDQYHTHS